MSRCPEMEKRANSPTCADLVEIFYEQAKLQKKSTPKAVLMLKSFLLLVLPFPCPLLCEPFVTLYATLISSSLAICIFAHMPYTALLSFKCFHSS